jgi:hypothetical protein
VAADLGVGSCGSRSFQIVSNFPDVLNIRFPRAFTKLLSWLNYFNLDFVAIT